MELTELMFKAREKGIEQIVIEPNSGNNTVAITQNNKTLNIRVMSSVELLEPNRFFASQMDEVINEKLK